MTVGLVTAGIILVLAALLVRRVVMHFRRAEFIRTYLFPKGLFDKLAARRPELARKDIALAARGLRHFFLAYLGSGRSFVSMPSQVADDL